jgi:UDPglucose 6-dehydrogenase
MRISVLGTGYLGATHAACLASCGHDVVGIDKDPARVACLSSGRAPFQEPGLDDLLHAEVGAGHLTFAASIEAAAGASVHFLCVGTPQLAGSNAADLSSLWDVVEALAPTLVRPTLVVGKSTVPVGTAELIRDRLQELAPAGSAVEVAWNPEFLREGHAVADSLHPDRLVFGVESERADRTLREVYAPQLAAGVPVVTTGLATAELAKVAANAMLATRISLVNLLAEVCEAARADVADLTTILGHDARIGSLFLTPGVGYGGGCLPKDTRAFVARAEEMGLSEPAGLLREVDSINMRQRARTVDLAFHLADKRSESTVAVLGAAFKAGSDDVRDSPALDVASTLRVRGARVRVYDPAAMDNARRADADLEYCPDPLTACTDADVVLVLTDWDEFRTLDPYSVADVVAQRRILDGRLVLDPAKWRAAGWDFHALGRRSV